VADTGPHAVTRVLLRRRRQWEQGGAADTDAAAAEAVACIRVARRDVLCPEACPSPRSQLGAHAVGVHRCTGVWRQHNGVGNLDDRWAAQPLMRTLDAG
jgi:hypothetical protein